MAQSRQDVYLPFQVFYLIRLVQSSFFVNFDSYFLVCAFAEAHLDNPISPLAKFSIDFVFLESFFVFELNFNIQEFAERIATTSFAPFLFHSLYLEFVHVVRSVLHQIVD